MLTIVKRNNPSLLSARWPPTVIDVDLSEFKPRPGLLETHITAAKMLGTGQGCGKVTVVGNRPTEGVGSWNRAQSGRVGVSHPDCDVPKSGDKTVAAPTFLDDHLAHCLSKNKKRALRDEKKRKLSILFSSRDEKKREWKVYTSRNFPSNISQTSWLEIDLTW